MKGFLWLCVAALGLAVTPAAADTAGSAAALREAFAALQRKPGSNPFKRPLYLDSFEGPDHVEGEIYALVDAPFSAASAMLVTPAQWCDVLILHLNTKFCQPQISSGTAFLHMRVGKKYDQPLEETYRLDFTFEVAARTRDYLQVRLGAEEGPLGTSRYRMMLEASAAPDGKTLVRLGYAYAYGQVGKLAMVVYLGTAGRAKVGFTVVGEDADHAPRYIGGLRGVLERNTMRYYLAVEASLRDAALPPQPLLDRRLADWFAGSERYPRQLREMGQSEYLAMKRHEVARQRHAPDPAVTSAAAGAAD